MLLEKLSSSLPLAKVGKIEYGSSLLFIQLLISHTVAMFYGIFNGSCFAMAIYLNCLV